MVLRSFAVLCRAVPCVEVVLQAAYEATLTIASCLAAKKGTRIKVWKKYESHDIFIRVHTCSGSDESAQVIQVETCETCGKRWIFDIP